MKLRHIKQRAISLSRATAIVAVFAVIGVFALRSSGAATYATTAEAETGTLAGNSATESDASASGGSAVKFEAAAPPSGQIPANTLPAGNDVGFLGDSATLVTADATNVPAGLSYNSGAGYFELSGISTKTFQGYRFTRPVVLTSSLPANAGITLTFKNNIFAMAGNQPYGGLTYQGNLGTNNIVIQDNTFTSTTLTGLYGNGHIQIDSRCTIQRNNISGRSDGIQNGSGQCLIEQNYIHSPSLYGTYPNNTHNDGIQFYSGSGIQVRYNRIDIGWDGIHQNGAIFLQGDFSGPIFDNNFFSGGGFTFRLEPGVAGAVVTNNTFKLPTINNPPWGPFTHSVASGSVSTWSGNKLSPGNTNIPL